MLVTYSSSKDASYSRQYDSFGGGIEATDLGVEIVQSMRQVPPKHSIYRSNQSHGRTP